MRLTGRSNVMSLLAALQGFAAAAIEPENAEGSLRDAEVTRKKAAVDGFIQRTLRRMQRSVSRDSHGLWKNATNERANARRRRQISKGMLSPIFNEHPQPHPWVESEAVREAA